jgi:uncharacterized SAM-binding protein YcdF (DUF218 family)
MLYWFLSEYYCKKGGLSVLLYVIKFFYQTFLLPPGIIIVLVLLLSIFLYRKHNYKMSRVCVAISVLLYIVSVPIVGDALIRGLESRHTPPSKVEGDVIIMLGAGTTVDTPNVSSTGHLTGYAANRLLTCVQLHRVLNVPIIISGGAVYENSSSEAEIAREILLDLGVEDDKIILEKRSLNTTQNAMYSKQIVESYDYKRPIIVTSAFHIDRALRQFDKAGLTVTPYPTDYQTTVDFIFSVSLFIPSADALTNVNLALKEYIGILASQWY